MGSPAIPFVVVTAFWGIIGIICPFFVRKSENSQIIRVCLILTAVCNWLFWVCVYLHQLNPLIGPELKPEIAVAVLEQWAGIKAHK